MAASTTPDNIVYPTLTDGVAPLQTKFSDMATSVQNALNLRIVKSYKWANASARAAQTGMTEGDYGDQADTDVQYRYNGSAWIMQNVQLFATANVNPAGAAPAGPKIPVIIASTAVVALDGTSAANINFVQPFPNALTSIVVTNGDSNTRGDITFSVAGSSLAGFVIVGRVGGNGAGTVPAVRVNYIAVGY